MAPSLTLPTGFQADGPVPLLVEVYGGSRVGASPHTFDRYRQLFATRGYAVFVPGIPLEDGTPMRDHADPERMGVFGHSYGGYGTLARYGGEGHAWRAWRTPNKIDYWQRTLDWFDEHLSRGSPEGR